MDLREPHSRFLWALQPVRSKHHSRTVGTLLALALAWVGACGDDDHHQNNNASDATVSGDATVLGDAEPDAHQVTCGDGLRQGAEACDGEDLGGVTCASLGLPDGQVTCNSDCTLSTLGCAVCGDGICSDAETAVSCAADCGVVSLTAGYTHSCAALADGTVWCWGARDGHRMGGTGDVRQPVMVPGLAGVVEVAAGLHHTCVRTSANDIYCWGANAYGQVGVAPPSHEVFPPVQVTTGTKLYLGAEHSCVRYSLNEVRCWGRLYAGRHPAPDYLAIATTGLVAAGGSHVCFVNGSDLRCFGRNGRGQLGLGHRGWREAPAQSYYSPSYGYIALGAGVEHTCFAVNQPTKQGIRCFGRNDDGQLGYVPGPDLLSAALVSDVRALRLDGGRRHTCAMESAVAGPIYCFGSNARGQLGNGSGLSDFGLAQVTIDDVVDFDAGSDHTCAILPDQTARCWGSNEQGQIGHGGLEVSVALPVSPHRLGPEGGAP